MLFSLNKWNDHLTPSPFVPYPAHKNEIKEEPPANDEAKPMEVDSSSSKPEESKKVYTTVLHPTPASLHAEICLLASTPVPPNARGRHNSIAQTPATPASANPLTVSTGTTKSHPTILNDKTALTFEADYLLTTGPSLVLTPAESPEHAAAILEALAHPLHSRPVPPKKTRKRTVKEMAVDEAQAAEEERLMLIMDERHQASSIGAPDDGLVGSGSFEPSFKRWKTLESIKQKHEEEKIKKAQEQRAQAEKEKQKALKDQQQSRASSEAQARVTASTPTEQSPLEGKGTLREIIQRGGAAQQHLAQQRAQEQAAREAREQAAQQAAAAQAQAQAQAREREQAQAAQAAAQQAAQQQAREKAAAANHAAQIAAQQQAQAVAAQTPTSAPQQTTATQGSPIAAASSPFAHQGSPPMPSRTSNHSSQPGSRQQSPHMSTVQSIQHQHAQPMPGSPAMHASPMMRATSQAMHGSPAMNQGSPLARNIAMVGNQHNMSPAQQIAAHQMMMANAARNQNAINMAKNAGQQMHATPETQKAMMQRAFLLQQQQNAFRQQQQILANQAAAAHAAQQQNQQHGMMDGMNVAAGMHPAMAGRGYMAGMVPANGMHMNGMMGGMQMGMNGYPQMMAPNGMAAAGGIPMGMMNGAALQGYNPAQINMLMAARGRGQPPQGQ
ncbi:Transcription factor spt20 [Orbilia ellipsospora]|uniref:Transcription factor spt20 n=1 Tax=Orbilia ellipsospora TaxID=2528407 RepID=A0AAV9XEP1_9PEZI